MWKEFKEFAFKGNVIDMAVGVIIGGAFGKIVTSIVNDIVMPVIGFILAGVNFAELKFVLSPEVVDAAGNVTKPEAAIMYGNFIQQCVDFFIIAICIFVMVKLINNASKKAEELAKKSKAAEETVEAIEETPAEPAPPTEAELLLEIRDLLKAQQEAANK